LELQAIIVLYKCHYNNSKKQIIKQKTSGYFSCRIIYFILLIYALEVLTFLMGLPTLALHRQHSTTLTVHS
jgi:hypothetical protein